MLFTSKEKPSSLVSKLVPCILRTKSWKAMLPPTTMGNGSFAVTTEPESLWLTPEERRGKIAEAIAFIQRMLAKKPSLAVKVYMLSSVNSKTLDT